MVGEPVGGSSIVPWQGVGSAVPFLCVVGGLWMDVCVGGGVGRGSDDALLSPMFGVLNNFVPKILVKTYIYSRSFII